ncbi:MAG: phage tail protein, partial [Staphylococcus equorum]|nr:phage tail protein [Staphylococcus equorum]
MENYDIIVTDLNDKMSELLLDFAYDTFVYEYERNNTRQITFTAYKSSKNEDVFNMLQNESYIEYQGQRYVIKNADASYDGLLFTKEITAFHIMYEFQNHFVSKDITSEELNDEASDEEMDTLMTLEQFLNFAFKDNKLGYSYEIKGSFNKSLPVNELGGKNGIEYILEGAEIFNYIYFADNKKITFYDHNTFYNESEKVVRYRYNND